jgi:hypothetical protein
MRESEVQTFVVRFWIEERSEPAGQPVWVGHVTNSLDRGELYVRDFDQLVKFMNAYLQDMGNPDPGIERGPS